MNNIIEGWLLIAACVAGVVLIGVAWPHIVGDRGLGPG